MSAPAVASPPQAPHIVIVGGGFGGLYTAKALGNQPVRVTLVDKRNFHLFQPLLYQVATGSLSPGDIASPLRAIFSRYKNIRVVMDEVIGLDSAAKTLKLKHEAAPLAYDVLIVATGGETSYFGRDEWRPFALGLKSVEDSLNLRRQIFSSFEAAEAESDPARRQALMTFVIVGGGPTGVELAGALAQLAHYTLPNDFRNIDCRQSKILLVDMGARLLAAYPEDLSAAAAKTLQQMGVVVQTGTAVTEIREGCITLSRNGEQDTVETPNILWAAGVKASGLGAVLAEQLGCALDRGGRVMVNADFSLPNHPEVFVIGDLAHYAHTSNQSPLPGVAPVAMQEGRYVARLLLAQRQDRTLPPFQYHDKGNLAVIGLKEAVADLNAFHLKGFMAWLIWAFVHILYLVEFNNKLVVMLQWGWTMLTQRQGARLITGKDVYD